MASAGTAIALNGLVFEVLANESGDPQPQRGTVLIWKLTKKRAGDTPTKGQWKNSRSDAEVDLWQNRTTAQSQDSNGDVTSGTVIGTVIKPESPPKLMLPTNNEITFEERTVNGQKQYRWVQNALQVYIAISYAKEHEGPYEYKNNKNPPETIDPEQIPPSVQQQ